MRTEENRGEQFVFGDHRVRRGGDGNHRARRTRRRVGAVFTENELFSSVLLVLVCSPCSRPVLGSFFSLPPDGWSKCGAAFVNPMEIQMHISGFVTS